MIGLWSRGDSQASGREGERGKLVGFAKGWGRLFALVTAEERRTEQTLFGGVERRRDQGGSRSPRSSSPPRNLPPIELGLRVDPGSR